MKKASVWNGMAAEHKNSRTFKWDVIVTAGNYQGIAGGPEPSG